MRRLRAATQVDEVRLGRPSRNQGVGCGDLYLFFGWFRRTVGTSGGLRYDRKAPAFQALWGYMQMGEVFSVPATPEPPAWAAYHRHFACRDRRGSPSRATRYTRRLPGSDLPGAGIFGRLSQVHRLPGGGAASLWDLPAAFHPSRTGLPLTSHRTPSRWSVPDERVLLDAAKQGQEFGVESSPKLQDWCEDPFGG